jgi:hypothetical protein
MISLQETEVKRKFHFSEICAENRFCREKYKLFDETEGERGCILKGERGKMETNPLRR